MRPNKKWHTTGNHPSDYPDPRGTALVHYFTLRRHSGGRYVVNIEPWVTDTDFSNGNGQITPAHFSYWGNGKLIGWQPLPRPMTEVSVGWVCEYRGDDCPGNEGWYLCTTTRDNRRFSIKGAYWDRQKARWLYLWEGEDVIAWRNYPGVPSDMARSSGVDA